jgi:2-octaprenyl-6-methoxyphenol hydroxylase
MDDIETDVLIIGAGIAGSALACGLRNSGMRVVLIDKTDKPLDTARGDHLQPRTCEILERWGVLQNFFDNGAEKRAGAIWMTPDGDEIFRSSVADLDIPHPYFAYINHETIATTLLDAALESGNTEVIRPIRNWWLEEDDGSQYTIKVGLPDSQSVNIRAPLLVGADGRASRTRTSFEISATAHKYDRGIAVFFSPVANLAEGNFLNIYLGESITSVIPRTGGGCKIGIPIPTSESSAWRKLSGNEVVEKLRQGAPAIQVESPKFGDIYAPVYLQADEWVKGGVVLIGDSCHAMHPARSQGMNISIRCIDELVDLLTSTDGLATRSVVESLLLEYQNRVKERVSKLLEKNHKLGLEMDVPKPGGRAAMEGRFRAISRDGNASRAYSMGAAGY